MEADESGGGGGGADTHKSLIDTHWYWAIASVTQFGWAVSSFRKGVVDHRLMPAKAFGVASLFLGSGASASIAFLKASGIHKVEDLIGVGANIRSGLGVRSRTGDK